MLDVPWMLQVCSRSLDAAFKAVESARIILSLQNAGRCSIWSNLFLRDWQSRSVGAVYHRNSFLAASAGAGMKQNCLPPGGYKGRGWMGVVDMWQDLADPGWSGLIPFDPPLKAVSCCFGLAVVLGQVPHRPLKWKSIQIRRYGPLAWANLGKFWPGETQKKEGVPHEVPVLPGIRKRKFRQVRIV